MNGLPNPERQRLGALLDHTSQEEVMSAIPQFAQAEIHNICAVPSEAPDQLGILAFNMERGVHLQEIVDFLEYCPDVQPFDVILANELDDGCVRSGQKDTTRELAQRLNMNYVFGLEFIELANGEDSKGHHGNAIFSRWPIKQAKVVRLPEQYNWYFDRQKRIGGRLAILAELDINGRSVGMGTIHLENRTHGEGRAAQMEVILRECEEMFCGMPVILGGDLNTNTFDGRNFKEFLEIASSEQLRRRCLEDVAEFEACLPLAEKYGYKAVSDFGQDSLEGTLTRRKPLPDGGYLSLRLDWILSRGIEADQGRNIPTYQENWSFAPENSALARFAGQELSDHNAVWANYHWNKQ